MGASVGWSRAHEFSRASFVAVQEVASLCRTLPITAISWLVLLTAEPVAA
jgi:hypothetical protein